MTGALLLAAACGGGHAAEPTPSAETSGGACETPDGCGGPDGGEEANRDVDAPPDSRTPEELARQQREAEEAHGAVREEEQRAREEHQRMIEEERRAPERDDGSRVP